jgi:crotonobetainyl-CoA:carnitine CoA-transferase CaiB-like acyl-CoA transferase
MATALEGLRVLDLTHGQAGALTTMILADNGAEVTRIEPPPSASYRGDPAAGAAGYVQWHRGKQLERLDLQSPAGQARAQDLAAQVDVVVDAFRPGVLDRLGLGWDRLSGANPGLIGCSITGFGAHGPYRDVPGYDAVVAAVSGKMAEFGFAQGRPLYVAVPFLSFTASQSALHGICGALLVRQQTGRGQRVETNLLAALSPYDILDFAGLQVASPDAVIPPLSLGRVDTTVAPGLVYLVTRTADGRWVQWANNETHLFWAQLETLGLGDLRDDPACAALPNGGDAETRMRVWELVLARSREMDFEELTKRALANGDVGVDLMRSTQEGMDHPQARFNGDVVEVDDARLGRTEQIGPIARFARTPSVIGAARPAATPWPAPGGGVAPVGGPLSGVTIVESAAMYAAPFGPAVLADYGARVIKVEPLSGDPILRYFVDRPPKTAWGKERVAVDLKAPEGQEIVHRLVAGADVFMHNYRRGVPERLGIDEATLRAHNDDLIYVYSGAYGADGPYSTMPAYHPSAGAACGNAVAQAGAGGRPAPDAVLSDEDTKRAALHLMGSNEGNPDANAAIGVASAIFLALVARQRHGVGQGVETAMLTSNAYVMSDDWIRYAGKPVRVEADAGLHGLGPGYRLYETADGWVFLACTNEGEWQRFEDALGSAAAPGRDDASLASLFMTASADEWQERLLAAGVACVRADRRPTYGCFLRDDPQATAVGLLTEATSPDWGTHRRQAQMATLSETPGLVRSAERLGGSTRRVLHELGYDDAQVDDLCVRGVVGA